MNEIEEAYIVQENGPEVSNDIDDEEDSTFPALHCQITAVSISRHGMLLGRFDEQVVHLGWGANSGICSICGEGEGQDNGEDDKSMHVIGQEGGLDTAKHGVQNNSDWE